jgi:hypothetical protein
MPSNKFNNNNKINNLAYVGDEEPQPVKFIRNRNHAKKDNKLTKDSKSHKKIHQERASKRFQVRLQSRLQKDIQERIAKGLEPEETIQYRIPESKKPKANAAAAIKGQPKRKAQENWNDQWEDTELGETVDLKEARKEVYRDECDYFCAIEMPKKIEDIEHRQYQRAKKELHKIISYVDHYTPNEMTWDLQETITRYENKQRLKELKSGLIMTLPEYEKEKATLNKVWTAYKDYRIPRHLFDGTIQCDENKIKLEICELEPVIDKKLRADLRAKIQEWENYLDHQVEMEVESARKEQEEQDLIQMIENSSDCLQTFVGRLVGYNSD